MLTTITPHDRHRQGGAPTTTSRAGSLLGVAILAYLIGVIGVVTLMPLRFQWPSHLPNFWYTDWMDIGANVCLFMPLGFVYRLGMRGQGSQARMRAWLFGVALSTGLEVAQVFLPGRYPCLIDVLANSLGGWLGATLHDVMARYLRQRLVGQLALELPLMTLFYLFLPLLWLNCLATGSDPVRLWLAPLLGLCGGSILAAVWIHRLWPAGVFSAPLVILLIAIWYVVGAFPGFARHPGFLVVCSLGVGCASWLLTVLACRRQWRERRFELPTLRCTGLFYTIYLALFALWPWPWTPQPWHGSLGFADLADVPGIMPILRLLEYLAAFTLLGYMIAEARGRQVEPVWHILRRLLLVSLLSGGVLEGLRGFHPQHTASLAQLLLLTAAGLYGGMVYRLQLATVQSLLAQSQQPEMRTSPRTIAPTASPEQHSRGSPSP